MSVARVLSSFDRRKVGRTIPDSREQRVELMIRVAREQPDLAHVRIGVFRAAMLSSPELIHRVLVEHPDRVQKNYLVRVFGKPLFGDGLLRLERDPHRRRRRMLAPAFMPRRIAAYADEMVLRAERSAARMRELGELDIADEALRVTLDIVGKTLFDAEVAGDAKDVGDALTAAMSCMLDSFTSLVPFPPQVPTLTNLRLRRAIRRLDGVVYRMIRQRREAGGDRGDLLSILLAARDEEDASSLSDRDVRDEAMTLFLAGHETTANTLAWAMYLLSQHRDARERLLRELEGVGDRPFRATDLPQLPWTTQVVKETLRLMPPVYVLGRQLTADLQLGDHSLRRGQILLVNILGMHRRPDLFPDPDAFDPTRFDPEREPLLPRHAFMPFGAGPRICIGNHFALMEAALVLATWMRRLEFEYTRMAPPGFEPLITLRPAGGIPMRVTPRRNS